MHLITVFSCSRDSPSLVCTNLPDDYENTDVHRAERVNKVVVQKHLEYFI